MSRADLESRMLAKLDRSGGDEACWLWRGKEPRYGYIRSDGNSLRINRVAYSLWVGEIPEGLNVLHRCDMHKCCNPKHLFLGTQADNIHDMIGKGRDRRNPPAGVKHWRAMITERQASIVKSLLRDDFRLCDAAFVAGCSYAIARQIQLDRNWVNAPLAA